jgi:hypothetical protein
MQEAKSAFNDCMAAANRIRQQGIDNAYDIYNKGMKEAQTLHGRCQEGCKLICKKSPFRQFCIIECNSLCDDALSIVEKELNVTLIVNLAGVNAAYGVATGICAAGYAHDVNECSDCMNP